MVSLSRVSRALALLLAVGVLLPVSLPTAHAQVDEEWVYTANTLQVPRFSFRATTLLDGRVLIEGGFAPGSYADQSEIYDPALDTWTPTDNLSQGRGEHTATLLGNGKVLVAGGYAGHATSSAELFDPLTETWEPTGTMQSVRTRHTATLLPNGKVLVTGGWNGSMTSGAELYDPATESWTPTGSMNSTRADHAAVLLSDGRVLVIGGASHNGTRTGSTEIYDPATGTWSLTGTLNVARAYFTAIRLLDGRVLAAGGELFPGMTDTAEVYEPSTGQWSLTGSMNSPRFLPEGHQALLLADGSVLVSGGDLAATSEVYLPDSGTWTSVTSMGQQRRAAATTLLDDGRALIVGGSDFVSLDNKLTTAQVYGPGEPDIHDTTPPTTTTTLTGTLGTNGWYTSNVTVTLEATDNEGGSGVATTTYGIDGGPEQVYTTSFPISGDGNHTVSYWSTDVAGNLESPQTLLLKIDTTPPTLALSVSPNPVLLNGSATATAGASDETSGIASEGCAAVDTTSVGAKTVTCSAADNAGNQALGAATYNVTYDLPGGFSSPVDDDLLNVAKAGKTIPLKWRVTDSNGTPITNLTSATITTVSLSCTTLEQGSDVIEEYAAGSSGLQNLGDGYYQLNWKSPSSYAGSCRELRLDMDDGIYHTAVFQFTK